MCSMYHGSLHWRLWIYFTNNECLSYIKAKDNGNTLIIISKMWKTRLESIVMFIYPFIIYQDPNQLLAAHDWNLFCSYVCGFDSHSFMYAKVRSFTYYHISSHLINQSERKMFVYRCTHWTLNTSSNSNSNSNWSQVRCVSRRQCSVVEL